MFEAKAGNGAYLNSQRINVSDRTDENSILGIAMIVYNVLVYNQRSKEKGKKVTAELQLHCDRGF